MLLFIVYGQTVQNKSIPNHLNIIKCHSGASPIT